VDLEEIGWSYAHFGLGWKGKGYKDGRGCARVTVEEFA
jgi:hypothetical protein